MSTLSEAVLGEKKAFWAKTYGEPGHGPAGPKGILFANWNNYTAEQRASLKTEGFSLEWLDEWIIRKSGKAYYAPPDS
jgi:hypothetical protein